jgi:ATPase subunit of ABC transporter with duplicated ATPase domains
LARSNIARPFIKFEMKRPSGKHILEVEGVTKSYSDNHVIRNFTASVTRGEKIALMGRNGAGKTTLLNALLANSPNTPETELRQTSGYNGPFIDAGKTVWGHEAAIGYFPQDHRSLIEKGSTILDWIFQWDPSVSNEEIRGLLGQMLFVRDEATKKTDVLSGGEAARILFCKLMLQKPNVLVLDEPTNHLDLESINALNIALQRYQGTVFLVTHDHDLIDEVATRIWHFDDHKIEDFKGTYEEYQTAMHQMSVGKEAETQPCYFSTRCEIGCLTQPAAQPSAKKQISQAGEPVHHKGRVQASSSSAKNGVFSESEALFRICD